MKYLDSSIDGYLRDLAARKPAPGGGSAAALSASIGVALMLMSANYTKGNPKYKASDAAMADIITKASVLEDALKVLIDKDVQAYELLVKLKTDAPQNNKEAIGKAYKEAAEVPFQICRMAAEALYLCKCLAEKGNKNLISDTATAAIMLEGAFFSAKYNVYLNLECVDDIVYIGNMHKVLSPLEEELPKLKEDILEICEDAIGE